MSVTVGEMLERSTRRVPDKTAIICGGNQVTYQELNARVNRLARGFLENGTNPHARVAVLVYNSIEAVMIYFALAKAGIVGIPLNFRLSSSELSFIVEDSGATTLIVAEELEPLISPLKSKLRKVERIITVEKYFHEIDAYGHLSHNRFDQEPEAVVAPEDESFVIYTSGTTGQPRGAVLTHKNHFWNSLNYTVSYRMDERDVELALTPLFHSSTLGRVFTYVFNGATFITAKRFNPAKALERITHHRVTSITQTPTMYRALFHCSHSGHLAFNSVKRVVCGAAPLFPQVREEIHCLFPLAGIFDLYGLTEASPGVSILTPYDPPEKITSVGKPMMSVAVKIVDEDGRELPPGECGEIVCRGPNVMKGYYNDLDATRAVLRGNWLWTGDRGKMDRDGYLFLAGRSKQVIISGGENIYPAEVEAVLHQHPLIAEAAVLGVPDDYWGETVGAVVVPRRNKNITEQEVINHCTEKLARYKRPRAVVFMTALPRNASGKVMHSELLTRYYRLRENGHK